MKRLVARGLGVGAVAASLLGACSPEHREAAATTPGVDLAGMDASVAPGDSFFAYANGAWDKSTAIPADLSRYGVGQMLAGETQTRTLELIQESAHDGAGDEARKISDFYASFMDESGIEAKGLAPLKPELDAIAAISDKRALARAIGGALRADVDPLNATNFHTDHLLGLFVSQALDDPTRNAPYLLQGGLGMPDREYYLSDTPQMAELRARYQAHIAAVLTLAGASDPDAKAKAARIYALERRIAVVHTTRVDSEDVHGAVSWTREELSTRAPGLDWVAFLEAAGLEKESRFFIWHPKATTGLAALVGSERLDTWKDWLADHAIEHAAPWLPRAFVAEGFAFYGNALNGTSQQPERWKRGVDVTNDALGEAVGKLYVQRYFSPQAKAQAQAMCDDLVRAFGKRIDALDWMSLQTRTKAKEKLATIKIGVGYPDTWRDYTTLQVLRGDAFGNARRAELFEYHRTLAKLGRSPDRSEWWITPQTVDALNIPLQNALNFPAAILQPPYFDPRRAAALNYGAIGAIIGHEVSHSFDDQGSQFDAQGRLSNWWTKDDFDHFKAASEKLAAQFDAYRPLPDLTVNGHQTLGENIADVAGLSTAYDAFELSLGGKPAPVQRGFTGDQQFFLGFAQAWRAKLREAALRSTIVTNGHAPPEYRADTVRNIDAWYTAFQVKPGQKLYLAPADRVRVW